MPQHAIEGSRIEIVGTLKVEVAGGIRPPSAIVTGLQRASARATNAVSKLAKSIFSAYASFNAIIQNRRGQPRDQYKTKLEAT
jgi:hypothetical protein